MIEISCQVCLDLIPLVKDNVASEDSKKLVLEHIRQCEACKDNSKMDMAPSGNQ